MLTKDEREVEDLLSTQLSRKSQTASILSISTVSTKVLDIIDLLNEEETDHNTNSKLPV